MYRGAQNTLRSLFPMNPIAWAHAGTCITAAHSEGQRAWLWRGHTCHLCTRPKESILVLLIEYVHMYEYSYTYEHIHAYVGCVI